MLDAKMCFGEKEKSKQERRIGQALKFGWVCQRTLTGKMTLQEDPKKCEGTRHKHIWGLEPGRGGR